MTFKHLSLNKNLPDAEVNIEDKKRSNLFTWRGQFSPQLIETILCNYANKNDVIFDPFLGSGTVLFEAARLGMSAVGTEINPAAVSFARIYELINAPKNDVKASLLKIDFFISDYTDDLPLFKLEDIACFEANLIKLRHEETCSITKIILSALITGMDFEAKKTNAKRVRDVWCSLKENIENLPTSQLRIKCLNKDSRSSGIENNSVDFVVTSPPYINVFNYHQNYRKSVEKMGLDVLTVAKSEIGANRKFRQNRFLTVVQYCMDLSQVFLELKRVCKKEAKVIFIVGRESNVRRTAFQNAELIKEVAEITGFDLRGEQERVFKNKFGQLIYEEILRFTLIDTELKNTTEEARKIGQEALLKALDSCDDDVSGEITEAIDKSRNISPSPLLNKN